MSIVSTVSVPRPENDCVRRTWRQRTSARRRVVPAAAVAERRRTAASARVRVRRTERRQSAPELARRGVAASISGISSPRGSVRTMTRAVAPVSRALR